MDVPAIVSLVNQAFQVEKFFKIGERTGEQEIQAHLQTGHFLLLEEESNLAGCVYVEIQGERGYFADVIFIVNDQNASHLLTIILSRIYAIVCASIVGLRR